MNPFFQEMTKAAGVDDGRGVHPAITAGGVAAGLGVGHVVLGTTPVLSSAVQRDFSAGIKAGGKGNLFTDYLSRSLREAMTGVPAREMRSAVYKTSLEAPKLLAEGRVPVRTLAAAGTVLAGSAIAGGVVAHAIGAHFAKGE